MLQLITWRCCINSPGSLSYAEQLVGILWSAWISEEYIADHLPLKGKAKLKLLSQNLLLQWA